MENKGSRFKILFNTALYFPIYALFIVIFVYWSSINWHTSFNNGYEEVLFPWVIASLIINMIGFVFIKKVKYVDIGLIFVLCSYLFMFGHVFLKAFNLKTTLTWNPSIYFDETVKFHAGVYAVVCLTLISCGCMMINPTKKIITNVADESQRRRIIASSGWIFLIVGLIANVITFGKVILATLASNSYASYTSANTSGFADDLAYLLVPGILYLFCSRTLTKRKRSFLLLTSITYFVATMVFSGSRKTQLFAILTIILCYLWTRDRTKLNAKAILLLCITGVLFINLIYVIRENRFDLATIIPKYFESLGSLKFLSAIIGETFAEAGLSFYSVVAIVGNVPSVFSFEYGMTIVRTIPSILPIGWLVGDFFNKAASSYVINKYTGLPVGTSMLGDFYWNWGIVGGAIAALIFGVVISKISKRIESDIRKETLYFSMLYILLIGIRAGIFELFRPLVMVTLVPAIIQKIILRKL